MTTNLQSSTITKRVLSPVVATDNTPLVGQIIDTAKANYFEHLISTGDLADANATFTLLVEHGDAADLSDSEAVPDDFLEGTEAGAAFQFDDDNEVRRIGYKCAKRYCRITITPVGNTGNASICIMGMLSGLQYHPVTQPEA